MTDQTNQNSQTVSPDQAALQQLDSLFRQLPSHVYDWLFSDQATANVTMLAKKFNLIETQTTELARLTGLAILKEISLPTLALELKRSLSLDDITTRQLAVATALTQFLPIRDHLLGVEDFIRQLGGALPSPLPPLLKNAAPRGDSPKGEEFYGATPKEKQKEAYSPTSTPETIIVQKTLRQLAQDNKEALNQNLTASPIKVADFEQPVKPTIKNWLVDYVKVKGAGHHASLERSDYLFNSPNARALSEKERALVAEILRAYDDDLPLPIDESNQGILLEKLNISSMPAPQRNESSATAPRDERSEFYAAAPRGERSELYGAPQQTGAYREPISPEDLSGPVKETPTKPMPKLSGNIINLKDLE